MLEKIFKKNKYGVIKTNIEDTVVKEKSAEPAIPSGMWRRCEACGAILYKGDVEENSNTCMKCGKHFRIGAYERINITLDNDTFEEWDKEIVSANPLKFPGYTEKVEKLKESTGLNEAVVTGIGKIEGIETVICVMDSKFLMGSMGSVVGEKLTRAVERATQDDLPIIIFTASGGARMQEGIFSLMQMAKVSAALAKHSQKGLLYTTVITDPTTGGVTASFAMLGDIIIAEPGALIGFAGRRVIEQTVKQSLPEEFQTSEFLLEHGFIDKIVKRSDMKETLYKILKIHCVK